MKPFSLSTDRVGRDGIVQAAGGLGMAGVTPVALTRLISALCDDRMGADELTARIESHPALCARVLRVANSAYYGQARAVATIKRALLVLGSNAIRSIAAAACIEQIVPRQLSSLPDVPAVLRHSLATAVAAEMLALLQHPMLADDAFIAGILHNFGVVLQASLDPDGVAAMIATRRTDSQTAIRLLELTHCSIGHEECAATLFEEWHLPDSLVAAALYHHEPSEAPHAHRLLVTLVAAGTDLALACGNTFALEPSTHLHDRGPLKQLGLDEKAIEGVRAALPGRVDDLSCALR